jgi:hypothetical protein
MKESTAIHFCFKGERDYVHGTDIFNKTMQAVASHDQGSQFDQVDMVIRGITRHHMDLYAETDAPADKAAKVTISLNAGNERIGLVLMENDESIQCNYAYAEHEIISAAKLDKGKQQIELNNFSGHTLIEKIVALNKGLLHGLYPEAPGKWYFTRIKISAYKLFGLAGDDVKLHLSLKQNLQFKLTNTIFYINDHFAGNIYFSLV